MPISTALRRWQKSPERKLDVNRNEVRTATERYLLYALLPAWLVPGLLDWVMHRRTRIEETSGTRESVIHALMMTEVGVPVLMGLLLEISPSVLALMLANVVVHEATAFWDVSTAIRGHREVRPNEQHLHSFLEILPMAAASFMVCLHRDQLEALVGRRAMKHKWRIRLKRPRLSTSYLLGIGAAIVACLGLPYAEELWRCRRAEQRRARVSRRAASARPAPAPRSPSPPARHEVEPAIAQALRQPAEIAEADEP